MSSDLKYLVVCLIGQSLYLKYGYVHLSYDKNANVVLQNVILEINSLLQVSTFFFVSFSSTFTVTNINILY